MQDQQRLEKQMSGRSSFLSIRDWETEGLKRLTSHLLAAGLPVSFLDFYYSFQAPRLGKEFDLLRVSEDLVINVELKSDPVPEEDIQKQLIQNRHYLSTLARTVRSFTYISAEDRLLRLTNSSNLVAADFSELADELLRQTACYKGDLEAFFKEDRYLISPLTDPDRFLRRDYFLTAQQRDIRSRILNTLKESPRQGFVGLPGTGKTLLLFDLALALSEKESVCVLFPGTYAEELDYLNSRLKRISFTPCSRDLSLLPALSSYSAVLIDEAHFLSDELLHEICRRTSEAEIPVIFCYDREDAIAPAEQLHEAGASAKIEQLPGYTGYSLTNRIRMNSELSVFTHGLMHKPKYLEIKSFPSVSISYASDAAESELLLAFYREAGFVYIRNTDMPAGREYDKVVMHIGRNFYYDEDGFLRESVPDGQLSSGSVLRLYTGLNRAKTALALVISENEEVLGAALSLLQGPADINKTKKGLEKES